MPNRELFLKTTVTAGYVGQLVQRHLDPVGIPAYLLALVTHVRDHQPVTPSGIAAASGVPLTTLRDNIQRLVDRGLARRIPNPDDARSYLLELTPEGLALTGAADPGLARPTTRSSSACRGRSRSTSAWSTSSTRRWPARSTRASRASGRRSDARDVLPALLRDQHLRAPLHGQVRCERALGRRRFLVRQDLVVVREDPVPADLGAGVPHR